jgi:hypothetical protein
MLLKLRAMLETAVCAQMAVANLDAGEQFGLIRYGLD